MPAPPPMPALVPLIVLLGACNPDPSDQMEEQVDYRDPVTGDHSSGERGNVIISEILWSGSVRGTGDEAVRDPSDVFVEIRNEGNQPVDVSGWYLEMSGTTQVTWRFPLDSDRVLQSGEHAFAAARTDGCFVDPDWVIEDMAFPDGDPFKLTLRDIDERLIESAGSRDMPPFAGTWDLVVSRSMERIQLMFGGRGTEPKMWHHYTRTKPVDVPNDGHVHEDCRPRTLASPGLANSPDYSGAYASGGFE